MKKIILLWIFVALLIGIHKAQAQNTTMASVHTAEYELNRHYQLQRELTHGIILDEEFIKQEYKQPQWTVYAGWGCFLLNGIIHASSDVNNFAPNRWFKKHPNASERFFGEDQWRNKWKNGDPNQGEAFLGSSNVFVWTTDFKHAADLVNYVLPITGTGLLLYKHSWQNSKWYEYLAKVGIAALMHFAGSELTFYYYKSKQ